MLSLRPEPSVPTAKANKQHRLGKRREREAPASKHQTRPGNGSRTGRRGRGMPNPPREKNIPGANGDSPRGKGTLPIFILETITLRRKLKARKKRRRLRPAWRAARRKAICDRERARKRGITVITHNVRTMAIDGKHRVGRAAEVLGEYRQAGMDIIGFQETRRDGQSQLRQAGYVVYAVGRAVTRVVERRAKVELGWPSERPSRELSYAHRNSSTNDS